MATIWRWFCDFVRAQDVQRLNLIGRSISQIKIVYSSRKRYIDTYDLKTYKSYEMVI